MLFPVLIRKMKQIQSILRHKSLHTEEIYIKSLNTDLMDTKNPAVFYSDKYQKKGAKE